MDMPKGWTVGQLLADFFAMFSRAADREVESLQDHVTISPDRWEELELWWVHHTAAAFLTLSFSIIESVIGERSWIHHAELPQDEFAVWKCIRDAVVHNGGDLARNRDATCLDTVREFANQVDQREPMWNPIARAALTPCFEISGSRVLLKRPVFERIYCLMEALCRLEGLSIDSPDEGGQLLG